MNKGNSVITIIIAVALAFVVALGVSFLGSTKGGKGDRGEPGNSGTPGLSLPGPQGPKGDNGEVDPVLLQNLSNVLRSLSNVVNQLPKPKLGAVVGPDFYGPYWGVNDVVEFRSRQIMNQSTSTVCSLQSPSATSTLLTWSVSFQTATTGVANLLFDVARDLPVTRAYPGGSTTGGGGFATSSSGLLSTAGLTVLTGGSGTFSASTTNASVGSNQIFGPNEFFVVKAANGNPTTCGSNCGLHNNAAGFLPVGTCNAVWIATERINR